MRVYMDPHALVQEGLLEQRVRHYTVTLGKLSGSENENSEDEHSEDEEGTDDGDEEYIADSASTTDSSSSDPDWETVHSESERD